MVPPILYKSNVNQIIIDLGALRSNFIELKRLVGLSVRIIGVVKSDGYGHGMVSVSKTLVEEGIDYLGVFMPEEGVALRNAGIHNPILIMNALMKEDMENIIQYNLIPTVCEMDTAEILSKYSMKNNRITSVHVKIDTGMTRLGVDIKDSNYFIKRIRQLKGISLDGISSHLSMSEMSDNLYTKNQILKFGKLVKQNYRTGSNTCYHISNSGAILQGEGLSFEMVRPGLLLYGCSPDQQQSSIKSFQPVMTFKSRIVHLREIQANVPVSYGGTFITQQRSKVAVIPVGYYNGFSRLLSNKGEILIHGKRVPVIGNVCMNMTMLDVTALKDVKIGDEAVILGKQDKERISAEEIAKKIGTINYEILCSFGKSNNRVYIE